MTTDSYHFADVTLLITHYNRSASLERLLAAFEQLNCSFEAIVVSDDGSRVEHQVPLQTLERRYSFRLITTPQNRGLGHNINKGQAAVTTAYTLYVQEDFVPQPAFAAYFRQALTLMQQDEGLDLVRFYGYFQYPYLKPYVGTFAEMIFRPTPWYTNHLKFYYYSDHPHLRRRSFTDKFGRYPEGLDVDKTEFGMCLSVLKNGGRGAIFTELTTMFDQKNSVTEPSTATFRAERNYDKWPYRALRQGYLGYRLLKNTAQLFFFDRNQHKAAPKPQTEAPKPAIQ